MNLINTLKFAAAVSAIALSFVSAPSFAATADAPSIKTCPSKGNCDLPDQNGPSLDGFVVPAPAGVKQHGKNDMNGPSLDGFATPKQLKTCPSKGNCEIPDQNGPSLDGFVVPAPAGAKPGVCYNDRNGLGLDGFAVPAGVIQNGCHDLNGPSLDGFADAVSQAPSIRTCTKTTAECADPNGPSLDGLANPKLGTVVIAIDKP
ncbi:hypothetical protein DFR24_4044 [Panacagrimonas perspica]|uniref:Uncharacterized protein n=1 Tax=Panacagrimonas perspica TaxID=381431 RepID=A0A4S3K6L2_9GAMM|nr:hypothetical protein [Panacagrimonas perspica]TDU25602.1 hypothetical protein DFR24_4044 [Panacagrimonas perspica]THD03800.1 hypothetical protein B1810_07960 [Panacagrimonas perspica]